jgi:hypothetical protein
MLLMNVEEDVDLRSSNLRKDSQITMENDTTLRTDSDKEFNAEI